MRGRIVVEIVASLAGSTLAGCAVVPDARYVYQDGQYGVVAIPKNTSVWPHHYREQAEALMARHFPKGFEIVRAEEVVEGSRTLTSAGTGTAELTPSTSIPLLRMLTVGGTVTRSQTDSLSIKECRIIHKKAGAGPPSESGGYAPEPSWTPTCYIDPNASSRKRDGKDGDKSSPPKEMAQCGGTTRDAPVAW
jgi:hypothetical protein